VKAKRRIEIIAEIGINHNGDMELAKEMIETAKAVGADVVKFQIYDPEMLLDKEVFTPDDWEAILASRLTRRQVLFLNQVCEREQIEFMASVFDLERIKWTEEIRMKRYKIASRSVFDEELCLNIIGINKPVIVSDGILYTTVNPIPSYFIKSSNVRWLYCVAKYPARLADIDFGMMKLSMYSGFSDHTIGTSAAKVAMSLGARIIEKHFTMDKTLPGPDHICSADPEELLEICRFRDDCEEILYKTEGQVD